MEALQQLDAILGFVWKPAVATLGIVFVYEGTRLLVVGGMRRRALAMLIPAISLMLLMGSVSLWVSHKMSGTAEKLSLPAIAELPSNWGADQAPEVREQNSRSFALVTFIGSGNVVKYFDRLGGWQPYHPTDHDLAMREQAIVAKSKMEQLSHASYIDAFRWLIFGVIAVVLGWYSGRKGANSTPRGQ